MVDAIVAIVAYVSTIPLRLQAHTTLHMRTAVELTMLPTDRLRKYDMIEYC